MPWVPRLTTCRFRIGLSGTVALVLSGQFGVPEENLTTQGYGERYLKPLAKAPPIRHYASAVPFFSGIKK
jgi:hypothetical protein